MLSGDTLAIDDGQNICNFKEMNKCRWKTLNINAINCALMLVIQLLSAR